VLTASRELLTMTQLLHRRELGEYSRIASRNYEEHVNDACVGRLVQCGTYKHHDGCVSRLLKSVHECVVFR
jgi:hypothetical protein